MLDCRYYDLCCFTDDSCNGEPVCPKRDYCQFYSPMPNVNALLALADEMDAYSGHFSTGLQECTVQAWAVAIREALGVDDG